MYDAARGPRFLGSEHDSEVDGQTVFWVASCTKIVVTIAVLQCVERGQVTLETIPTDILPELKTLPLLKGWSHDGTPLLGSPKRYPTIREILSHQSGIGVDISELDLLKWSKYTGRQTNSQSGNIVGKAAYSRNPTDQCLGRSAIPNAIRPRRGMDLFGWHGLDGTTSKLRASKHDIGLTEFV